MISPNYSILKPTVFVLTAIYAKVFEQRWRSQKGHVTSHQGQSIKIEGAPMVPLSLKFGAIPTIIYKVTAFWKKIAHVIYLWSAAILKVSVEPYRFSNIP